MSKEMLNALDALEAEKGISKEIVIDALEAALVSAYFQCKLVSIK